MKSRDGTSVLIRIRRESVSLLCSLPFEDTIKSGPSATRTGPHQNPPFWHLVLGLPASRTVKKNCCL